ncbi:MAG TPA: DNA mismatch repair protein MutS [Aggregatilineales bacterium]|nr:DNA mismatch repair protein MutS [Chloroflexota bacterium]HOA22613.1 DNA mismatch repair protein MutS [Aggregatilineales bacterium]HPV07757.1 DNA mismatch repair protein MutS [Aggregatilineales bacterium]HQA67600.1 DNA mismatch repair protein MutS [Aggregatilineales bacterium]HQE17127.1 DNA mismatch repair protein MutS [Aggregatilineales bacterium]
MSKATPVRQQYLDIKKQFPNAIVFFRLGDFYETFDEDAEITARELDIVLTSRNVSKNKRVPMAGVPHHAAESYIARLIEKGYHVAICEQVSDEPVNGLMPREVVRVVTPGTVTEPTLLPQKQNSYLVAIAPFYQGDELVRAGVAYADISTGEFAATELCEGDVLGLVQQEIARLAPRECLLPESVAESGSLPLGSDEVHVTPFADWRFDTPTAEGALQRHFRVDTLIAFGLADSPAATSAAGAVLQYLQETQRGSLDQLRTLTTYTTGDYMTLDAATRRNLELTQTIRGRSVRGSLLGVIDQTITPMGGRLLRHWVSRPLLDIARLERRLDTVEALFVDGTLRAQVREALKNIADLERLTNRLVTRNASPRELISLKQTLQQVPVLRALLIGQAQALKALAYDLDPADDVVDLIERAIVDDPPATLNNIGVIRRGYSPELDQLVQDSADARRYINSLERVERERTGIKSLKVGHNKVFGYYIEVTKANAHMVPSDYVRKQTLVNAERYITPEMKDVEVRLLNAEEEIHALEVSLYRDLLVQLASYSDVLLGTARAIARLDVCAGLAEVAARRGYVRPKLTEEDVLDIRAGRHPVVEQWLQGERFVPNDTLFTNDKRIHIITGPNMSGKSTYLRQVALIVLLAQIGSFVPADEATIGLVDRIFTRIGAQDEIHAGQSTFMVEMIETALILQQSTRRSLVILDEVGRGTSTYDGLAIARAVIEYLHNHPRMGGKTLFATHYHELTELENILPHVANYNVAVAEQDGQVAFLHTIVPGKADKSYGIYVAQLAGVPEAVVARAADILKELEAQHNIWAVEHDPTRLSQLSMFDTGPHPVIKELRKLRIEEMSPIDAITKLYELQRRALQDDVED